MEQARIEAHIRAVAAADAAARRHAVKHYAEQRGMADLADAERAMDADAERERRKAQRAQRKRNKITQATYRAKHGEQLRAARRVALALMKLRSRSAFNSMGTLVGIMADIELALSAFLTREEFAALFACLERSPFRKLTRTPSKSGR